MRILNRRQFLAMPANTLFFFCSECEISDMAMKMCDSRTVSDAEAHRVSFHYIEIGSPLNLNTVGAGESCADTDVYMSTMADMVAGSPADMYFDCVTRDSFYDHNQLFMVFDSGDIDRLLTFLQTAKR